MSVSSEELKFILKMRDEATQVLKRAGTNIEKTGKQAKRAGVSFGDMAAAAATAAAAISTAFVALRGAGNSLEVFGNLEQQLINVQKTTGLTDEAMSSLKESMLETSRVIPKTAEELSSIAAVAGQIGIHGVKNIEKFTAVIAKLEDASGGTVVGEEGAKSIARLLKLTKEGPENVDRFASALTILGNNAAATEGEILNMASEVTRSTSAFGLTSSEILGLSTVLTELDQRAELSGSAMFRLLNTMRDAEINGGDSLKKFANTAGVSVEEFAKMVRDKPVLAVAQFAGGLKALQDQGVSTTSMMKSLELGSVEINKVLGPMSQNWEDVAARINLANKGYSENVALNEEAQRSYASLNNQVRFLANAWNEMTVAIGGALAPAFSEIISILKSGVLAVTDFFKNMDADARKAVAVVGVLTIGLGGVAVALAAITPIVGLLASGFALLTAPVLAIGSAIAIVTAGFVTWKNTVEGIVGESVTWTDLIKAYWMTLGDVITDSFEAMGFDVSQVFSDIAQVASVTWMLLPSGAKLAWEDIKKTSSGGANAVIGHFVGMWNFWKALAPEFGTVAEAIGDWIALGVSKGLNTVLQNFKELMLDTADLVQHVSGDMAQKIRASVSGIGDGTGGPAPGASIADSFETAMDRVKDAYVKGFDKDYVGELIKGVGDGANAAWDTFAARYIQNVKETAGILRREQEALGVAGLKPNSDSSTSTSDITGGLNPVISEDTTDSDKQAEKEANGIRRVVEALRLQTDAYTQTAEARAYAQALASAGITQTKDEANGLIVKKAVLEQLKAAEEDRVADTNLTIDQTRRLTQAEGLYGLAKKQQIALIQAEVAAQRDGRVLSQEAIASVKELAAAQYDLENATQTVSQAANEFWYNYIKDARDAGAATKQALSTSIGSLEDEMTNFFTGQATDWRGMVNTIISEITRMAVVKPMIANIMEGLGGGSSGSSSGSGIFSFLSGFFAKGEAFGSNVQAFAKGGAFSNSVVSSPTLFKFAKGGGFQNGVMGEKGPEAVMPLRRNSKGQLGVMGDGSMAGGADTYLNSTVNVTVNGDGSEGGDGDGATGDMGGMGKELGTLISLKTKEIIQDEMRPGGLLYKGA